MRSNLVQLWYDIIWATVISTCLLTSTFDELYDCVPLSSAPFLRLLRWLPLFAQVCVLLNVCKWKTVVLLPLFLNDLIICIVYCRSYFSSFLRCGFRAIIWLQTTKQFKQNWFTRINILIESVTAELIVKWSLEVSCTTRFSRDHFTIRAWWFYIFKKRGKDGYCLNPLTLLNGLIHMIPVMHVTINS